MLKILTLLKASTFILLTATFVVTIVGEIDDTQTSQTPMTLAANHFNNNIHHTTQHKGLVPAPASFITTEKKSQISGIRIEPDETGGIGFIGYTDKGMSIVEAETLVRVVVFGFWLDEIVMVGFTSNENCSATIGNVTSDDFVIQTEKRMVIKYEFTNQNSLYKICMKQKKFEVGEDMKDFPFALIDDVRTTVTTEKPERRYTFHFAVELAVVALLLVLSGLFSGLNLGLMSLTPQELTLISNSGSSKERRYAQTILPIRKSGNFLLCSLLIGNVCVNVAISLLFDDLTSGIVSLIVSSAGIVVFGEIFPQALCVKKGLAVGARTIWVTRFFMMLTSPLAWPISKILDFVLGQEVVSYDRKRLMELIRMSTKNAGTAEGELKIAIGAMELADKTVYDVMTKIDDVFMLPEDTILNTKVVAEIVRSGYTRIPVYSGNRNNVVSLLFVKDLALLDPDDNFSVKTVCAYHLHMLKCVPESHSLRQMLDEFKRGEYHLAMVERVVETENEVPYTEMLGIVTLEDIIEEILQAEIVDETDVITDNVSRIRRRQAQTHDFNLIVDEFPAQCSVSMQMQLVTLQFLVTQHRAFYPEIIGQAILQRLIRKNVHKVDISNLANDIIGEGTNMVYPRSAKLYTKQEPSDKFILILEGRAMVTIGKNEMTFEAGPWHCFGTEMLDKLDQLITNGPSGTLSPTATATVIAQPSQNAVVSNAIGKSGNRADSLVILQQQQAVVNAVSTANHTSAASGGGGARSSQGALHPSSTGPTALFTAAGSTQQEVDAKKITFVPDYSMVIRDECTYLEITAQTYLIAYKSTLISKNKNPTTKDSISSPHQHQPPIDETIALSKPSLVSTLSSGNGRTGHGDSIRSLPNNGFIIGGGSCTSTSTTATLGDDMIRRHGGFDETHTTEYEPDSILKGHNRNRLSRLDQHQQTLREQLQRPRRTESDDSTIRLISASPSVDDQQQQQPQDDAAAEKQQEQEQEQEQDETDDGNNNNSNGNDGSGKENVVDGDGDGNDDAKRLTTTPAAFFLGANNNSATGADSSGSGSFNSL